MVLHCNLSTGEVGAGGSGVQDHSQLQGEFEASLGYINKMKWEEEACVCVCVCSLTTYDGREKRHRMVKVRSRNPRLLLE